MQLSINGDSRQVQDGSTIADLLEEMNLSPQQVAVEVNLQLIPRDDHREYRLANGDKMEVVTLAGGG